MSRIRFVAPLPIVVLLVACSSDSQGLPPSPGPDAGTGTSDTSAPADTSTGTPDGSSPSDAAETDTETPDPIDPFLATFLECSTTSDCGTRGGAAQVCVEGVCVIPARSQASLAEEITTIVDPDSSGSGTLTTITARPDEPVMVGCYSDGTLTETTEGPETALLEGFVERFGSGPATNRLCVVAYENDALLRWLISSPCNDLRTQDDDLYIGCFQLDPCRCEEAFVDNSTDLAVADMIEGAGTASGAPIRTLDACYGFVGACDAITDATARAACVEQVRTRTESTTASTLVIGHTRSAPNDENPDWGYFEIPNIPTNRTLAFKTSGDDARWVDTYKYGISARAELVGDDGRIRIDGNAVTYGTWNTIPSSLGIAGGISPRNGAVAGAVRDCGVRGVRPPWNVVGATVGISFESNATALEYFNGVPSNPLPQPGRADTNIDGLYAAINLPAGPNRVAPTICTENCDGQGGEPVFTVAGGRNVFQTPKSVIIASFEGVREN